MNFQVKRHYGCCLLSLALLVGCRPSAEAPSPQSASAAVNAARSSPSQREQSTATPFQYFPAQSTLHGTLLNVAHFGAPNFGEDPKHDAKIHVLVLRLANPINVKARAGADPNKTANLDDFTGVREVQLEFKEVDEARAITLVGRPLSVSGTLSEAVAPGEYTKVTLAVTAFPAN